MEMRNVRPKMARVFIREHLAIFSVKFFCCCQPQCIKLFHGQLLWARAIPYIPHSCRACGVRNSKSQFAAQPCSACLRSSGSAAQAALNVSSLGKLLSQKTECRHFAEDRSSLAVCNWRMEHERPLRFAGQNAVNPVAEFMGKRHHVVIRTQVIQERERLRAVPGKHKRTIKSSAAFSRGRGNVDALGRDETPG